MNRETVIQLASEQGDFSESKYGCAFIINAQPEDTFNIFNFANAIEQRTLERAAAVCEARAQDHAKATGDCSYNDCDFMAEAIDCAAAIRALKDTP